jgi:hypothetical protein
MTDQRHTQRKHPVRRIVYLALVLVLVIGIGFYLSVRVQWSRRIDRQIKAMREAGLPTNPMELNRWYRLPGGVVENAANYYLSAFAYVVEPNEEDANQVPLAGTGELPGRTEPLPDQTKEAIVRFVAANKQALDLLNEAATIPACRYPVDFNAGPQQVLLPWLSEMRRAVFLLSCDALLHTEERQSALTGRSIESALCLARSLLAEPVVVSQLVRMGIQSKALSTLERVISRDELPLEQIIAIDLVLTRGEEPNALRRALVGQCLVDGEIFEHPPLGLFLQSDEVSIPGPIRLGLYQGVGLSIRDKAEYLETIGATLKALELPEAQRLTAIRAVETQSGHIPRSHLLLHDLMPSLSGFCEMELRSLAQIRAAQTALAIERYRLKVGRPPEGLDSLVPEYLATIPTDPFTGQSLKYRELARGYVVYSVGKDLSDDGGKEKPPRKDEGPYDVTFIVER